MAADKLNEQQKEFCRQYLILGYNATQAYLKVYPNSTYEAAGVSAHDNLKKPKIQDYIKELQKDVGKTVGITPEMIAEEYRKMAFSSIAHMHNTWVTRKEFESLTDDQKACIQEISSRTGRSVDGELIEHVKVRLYDKDKALTALRKMLGYDEPDQVNHSGGINITVDGMTADDAKKLHADD